MWRQRHVPVASDRYLVAVSVVRGCALSGVGTDDTPRVRTEPAVAAATDIGARTIMPKESRDANGIVRLSKSACLPAFGRLAAADCRQTTFPWEQSLPNWRGVCPQLDRRLWMLSRRCLEPLFYASSSEMGGYTCSSCGKIS